MMPPIVQVMSREDLLRRRAELIEAAALSEDELRARAEEYVASPEQAALVDELNEIDFLLGD